MLIFLILTIKTNVSFFTTLSKYEFKVKKFTQLLSVQINAFDNDMFQKPSLLGYIIGSQCFIPSLIEFEAITSV